jgi:tetratricopeptide (TPR) repeat protein
MRDLEPDDRPLEDLTRISEVLSGVRVDSTGAIVPISTSELRESYEALLAKAPNSFTASPKQVIGWHGQQVDLCQRAGTWAAAVKHLDRLIVGGPHVDALTICRGLAHAELEHWRQAARDLDIDELAQQTDSGTWQLAALVRLRGGDRDAYRADCAGMFKHFGEADSLGQPAWFTAWTCALAPNAVDNYAPVLALAERLRADRPEDQKRVQSLGALLYRAGRFEEAVERLMEAERLSTDPRASPIHGWFFLAMAHHRLGHAGEARRWLDKAMTASDQAIGDHDRGAEPMQLHHRITLTLLRTEAAALLGSAELPDDVFAWP